MIKVDIENFRIIRDLHFLDQGKMSVLVGTNEGGKSSFVQAIRAAFTGEAYGHKGKDLARLVTHGESRFSVKVQLGTSTHANRTTSGGSTLKAAAEALGVPAEVMPLLFDARMCGDGGSKHMKAFLAGAGTARFNPLVAFAEDPAILTCISKAHQADKAGSTKALIAYCESQRAASRDPSPPVPPVVTRPTPADILAAETIYQSLLAAESAISQELTALEAQGAALIACLDHLTSTAAYAQRCQAASVGDPIGQHRTALTKVANVNVMTMHEISTLLVAIDQAALATELRAMADKVALAAAHAQSVLRANPQPVSAGAAPVLAAHARATWEALAADGTVTHDRIAALSAAAATRQAALKEKLVAARLSTTAAKTNHQKLLGDAGAWATYDVQMPNYATQAADARAEWARWDRAAKAIEEAEAVFNRDQGKSFGALVTEFGASILQGRHLRLDPQDGLFLGPETIEEVSDSTRWRIEVAVMAAVAKLLRSPILLIDGADILDKYNRAPLTEFIATHLMPSFEHIVLTASVRNELSEERPLALPGATKWLVTRGAFTKCA